MPNPKKKPASKKIEEQVTNPVPSRESIINALEQEATPTSLVQLYQILNVPPELERPLTYRLRAMERDGQILRNRNKKYGLVNRMNLIKGVVFGHPDGYGYLDKTDTEQRYFISPSEMRKVFHGDLVMVYAVDKAPTKGRQEIAIAEILKRNTTKVVGTLFQESGVMFVRPTAQHFTLDVIVPNGNKKFVNQIAEVKITHQPTKHSPPIGEVITILGHRGNGSLEINMALRAYGIPWEWPNSLLKQADAFSDTLTKKDLKQRTDLRQKAFVTIDGEDARDFDDAVFAEQSDKGWHLMVAIADVAHYVKPNSPLDKEAIKRGNSVYFPNQVVPMLPEVLSNGLCSLKPHEDRLCIVCDMDINSDGELVRFDFYKAVIQSHARLTYNEVAAFIDQTDNTQYPKAVAKNLNHLDQLYDRLKAGRKKRGAMEIESTQMVMSFDDDGCISGVKPYVIKRSHKIIEECMLLANIATARFLKQRNIPLLYRVHDEPATEKVQALRTTLSDLNLHLGGKEHPQPIHFCNLIEATKDMPQKAMLQMAVLRTFKQAVYSPENIGHFGLNFPEYTHFTSPIRRYPDLLAHRAIRSVIETGEAPKSTNDKQWVELGEHCSRTERRADDATRDVSLFLKAQFALNHVGEVFQGSISGVMPFGLFVFLESIGIDGLIHVSALKTDYYRYDEVRHQLRGERHGKQYSIGDQISVVINKVSLEDKKIDLMAVDGDLETRRPEKKRPKKKSKKSASTTKRR